MTDIRFVSLLPRVPKYNVALSDTRYPEQEEEYEHSSDLLRTSMNSKSAWFRGEHARYFTDTSFHFTA